MRTFYHNYAVLQLRYVNFIPQPTVVSFIMCECIYLLRVLLLGIPHLVRSEEDIREMIVDENPT